MLVKLQKDRFLGLLCMLFVLIHLSTPQTVLYSQNFDTGFCTNGSNYTTKFTDMRGGWYRGDPLATDVKMIQPLGTTNCFLSVYVINVSSIECVNIALAVSTNIIVKFDNAFKLSNANILYANWNGQQIFTTDYSTNGYVIDVFQTVNVSTTSSSSGNNILCFSGTNPITGTSQGPVIDNIIITTDPNQITPPPPPPPTPSPSPTPTPTNTNTTTNTTTTPTTTTNTTNTSTTTQLSLISKDPSISFINILTQKITTLIHPIVLFGFSYLISNFLNFWNIVVLYYFIKLPSFDPKYRIELLQMCQFALGEGTLFGLIHNSLKQKNLVFPVLNYEKVPLTEEQWPSFSELGFTSQLLINNFESYFTLINCILKIMFLIGIMKLLKMCKGCIGKIVTGMKMPFLEIMCYEVISNGPSMIIPLAVMLSVYSEISFASPSEKLNNSIQILALPLFFGCLVLPVLTKKFPRVGEKPKNPTQLTMLKLVKQKDSDEITKASDEYQRQMGIFKKQNTLRKFIIWNTIIETQEHALFIYVPFLVGLQAIPIFLVVNLILLTIAVVIEVKKRKIIMEYKKMEFWFRFAIKFVMLTIHLLFIFDYLIDQKLISIDRSISSLLNLITLIFIIFGALLQIFHTIVIFFIWIYHTYEKARSLFCNKPKQSPPVPMKLINNYQNTIKVIENLPEKTYVEKPQKLRVSVGDDTNIFNKSKTNFLEDSKGLKIKKPTKGVLKGAHYLADVDNITNIFESKYKGDQDQKKKEGKKITFCQEVMKTSDSP